MSQDESEFNKLAEVPDPRTVEHSEKSITGSAQGIGLEPGPDYIAPAMALDAPRSEPDSSTD